MRAVAAALCAAVAVSVASATHVKTAEPAGARAVRVACLGDSLTRGDASHEPKPPKNRRGRGNYPKALARALGARFDVRNFGHGGATATLARRSDVGRSVVSPDAYAALPEMAAARAWRPEIALWMLGTNDSKDLDEGAFVRDFKRTVEDLGSGVEHVIMTPPPVLASQWGIKPEVVAHGVPPMVRKVARAVVNAREAASGLPMRNRGFLDARRAAASSSTRVEEARAPRRRDRRTFFDLGTRFSERSGCAAAKTSSRAWQRCTSHFVNDMVHQSETGAQLVASLALEALTPIVERL